MENASLTPPAPTGTPSPMQASAQSSGGRGITIAAAVVGGVVLLGTAGGAAFAATGQFRDVSASTGSNLDSSGVTELDLEAGGATVAVVFGDVEQADLRVEGSGRGEWRMSRDGEKLVVRAPDEPFGWWVRGLLHDETTVTLTLPSSLEGKVDASLDVSSGFFWATGDFRDLDLDLGAGEAVVRGSAQHVKTEVSAGKADLRLADVRTAELSASAGHLLADITGSQPDEIGLELTAGSMDVVLPKGRYDVRDEVSAGTFDNRLDTSGTATSTVKALGVGGESERPLRTLGDFVIAAASGKVLEVDAGL